MKIIITLFTLSLVYGTLITPHNGSTIYHTHVLFEWKQIPEATSYEIQIAEDLDFSTVVEQSQDSSLVRIQKEHIEWNHTYYWRIRPIYNTVFGLWSNPFSFSTGQPLSSSSANIINQSQIQSGVTVFGAFFNYFSAAIDQNGNEVWNSGPDDFVYYSSSDFGNVFGCYLSPESENNLPGLEITFQGDTIWEEPNDEFLHHDLIKLPNGNYLGIVEVSSLGPIPIGGWTSSFQSLGFQADGVTNEFPWVGDRLVEWDNETKDVVWSWNVFDHFNMSDFDQFGGTWTEAYISLHYDWTHMNAVIFDEEESALYVSSRHLSRITKIDYPSGNILWNIGHQMSSNDINFGTDLGFSFQHSLQKLENGNILTFDNGNLAPEFRGTDDPISRAIEIEITDTNASIAWSYELPTDLFGFASGNAQKLENGNVLVTTVGGGGRSLEVDLDGNIVWEGLYNLSLPDGAVYRSYRLPDLFPSSYSVIIDNLVESNGDTGIYVPTGNASNIFFTLVNESGYSLPLSCYLSDDQQWFDNQTLQITLEPNSKETISFTGNVSQVNTANPIQLIITPVHQTLKSKTLSVNGFTSPLSIDQPVQYDHFRLKMVYPNPFNSKINIHFSVNYIDDVLLEIFNATGQLCYSVIKSQVPIGEHHLQWGAGSNPSGIYFIKMTSETRTQNQKILYLK